MNKTIRNTVAVPLIGLNVAWFIFMAANYVGASENGQYVGSGYMSGPEVKISTYLYLTAIAVFSAVASIAHSQADAQQLADTNSRPAHAAFRFASLAVIVGLVAGAIFAIGTFLSSFQSGPMQTVTLTGRLLGVYLPIILATALVILVLLRATVFRKSSPGERDESGKMSAQQRSLVFGFSLPIVATALAVIIGLAFWDIQGQKLDVWVWVVIQALIAVGIVLGTRFAVAARTGVAAVAKPRVTSAGAIGAVNLNYVLSIVFGVVVTLMAFSMGSDAIAVATSQDPHAALSFTWFINKLLPAYVLLVLATVGIYAAFVERHSEPKPAAKSE